MAAVLRWKLSAAMATSYAALAAVLIYFVRDQTAVLAALVLLFALELLAGNVYVKALGEGRAAQGAGHDVARAGNGRDVASGNAPATLHPAPRTPHPDPEMGRR